MATNIINIPSGAPSDQSQIYLKTGETFHVATLSSLWAAYNGGQSFPTDTHINELISQNTYTKIEADGKYQEKGSYLTSHQSLKTINNQSIVGTGNITISSGTTVTDEHINSLIDAKLATLTNVDGEAF